VDGVSLKNVARFNASMQGSQAENPGFSDNGVLGYKHFFLFISYWNDKKICQRTPMIFMLHEKKHIGI